MRAYTIAFYLGDPESKHELATEWASDTLAPIPRIGEEFFIAGKRFLPERPYDAYYRVTHVLHEYLNRGYACSIYCDEFPRKAKGFYSDIDENRSPL